MACIVSRPQNTHEIAEPMRMGPRIAVTSGIGDAGVAIAKNLSGMGRKEEGDWKENVQRAGVAPLAYIAR